MNADKTSTFEFEGYMVTEFIFRSWAGSGKRFGTVHGKLVWEFGPPRSLVHVDFDPGDNAEAAEEQARRRVASRFREMIRKGEVPCDGN